MSFTPRVIVFGFLILVAMYAARETLLLVMQ